MILHLILHHVARCPFCLLGDIVAQLVGGERLLLSFRIDQIHRLHLDERVDDSARLNLLAQSLQRTDLVVLRFPVEAVFADGVVADGRGSHVTDELLLLKLVEREAIACLRVVVVLLDIGNDAWSHHQLHVAGRRNLLVVLVFRLKLLSDHRSVRDDIGAEVEVHQGDESGREQVWPHEPLETHSSGEHRDDFGVTCQFGGEEDDGDEDEQRREEIGKIRNEVGIVVEHDGLQWCTEGGEFRQVLVDVEDDGDRDDEEDGVDIGADKLDDDIPVEP